MQRPLMAAQALRFAPDGIAGRADPTRIERVPDMSARAGPPVVATGLPLTLRAADLPLAVLGNAARLLIGLLEREQARHALTVARLLARLPGEWPADTSLLLRLAVIPRSPST